MSDKEIQELKGIIKKYESELQWQPMETAPKNSVGFEAYDTNGAHVNAFWADSYNSFATGRGPCIRPLVCWRHYPSPPSADTLQEMSKHVREKTG